MLTNYLLPLATVSSYTDLPADMVDGVNLGIRMMGAPLLWHAGFTGEGITVAIIDTGIDDSHPDLLNKVVKRRDYVNDGRAPSTWHPHGTHVAGTVAANGKLKGVAPKAMLADYRVLDVNGSGSDTNVAQAIIDAVNDGCHVINMSLGSSTGNEKLHDAIKYAVSKNVPVITAAGNEGAQKISYPAYYQEVIAVGAVEINPSTLAIMRAMFSNTNNEVDVAAFGAWEVISTVPGGKYEGMAGTSMACPHVAGFMALLLHRGKVRLGRLMSEPAAYDALKTCTADDTTFAGTDTSYGAGFVTVFPSLPKVRKVSMTIDVPEVIVDGTKIAKDVAPVKNTTANRIFAPVRHQAEPFWIKVTSDTYGTTAYFESWYIPGFDKITSK